MICYILSDLFIQSMDAWLRVAEEMLSWYTIPKGGAFGEEEHSLRSRSST
jgi:hypothetical protein